VRERQQHSSIDPQLIVWWPAFAEGSKFERKRARAAAFCAIRSKQVGD